MTSKFDLDSLFARTVKAARAAGLDTSDWILAYGAPGIPRTQYRLTARTEILDIPLGWTLLAAYQRLENMRIAWDMVAVKMSTKDGA